jgi:adenylate cyclase
VIRLDQLERCFHGIVPGAIATCDAEGTPNISYLSQVQYVDPEHVALSCQFFNKTRRNLDEHPLASLELCDPVTLESYRLRVRFVRSETSGPLFDAMAARIDAIASHSGMAGVFRLRSADVCRVLSIEARPSFLEPADRAVEAPLPPDGPLTELRALQVVSERINRAADLDTLLGDALAALDEVFGFGHGMIFVPDEPGRLVAIRSHGYDGRGVGAEVRVGEGLIGTVAANRRTLRLTGLASELRYGRAIRARVHEVDGSNRLAPEIPLPGLPDAESQMAIPLLVCDQLVGVLALETRDPLTFASWHETFLQVLANQIAIGMERLAERTERGEAEAVADNDDDDDNAAASKTATPAAADRQISLCYYRNDDCVFVDREYLVRNVPAKILWKLLRAHQHDGRVEFSNRELRLDPSLGLPPIKDNLESRLILLRKRLVEKCPELRIVPIRRGRFALEVRCTVELVERDTA